MIQNKFGEQIYAESDIVDLLMSGRKPVELNRMFVDNTVNIENIAQPSILKPAKQSLAGILLTCFDGLFVDAMV
jgi:hypothetical protein